MKKRKEGDRDALTYHATSISDVGVVQRTSLGREGPPASTGLFPWTEQEVATLRRMWPRHTEAEIANVIGRTRSAVSGKIVRLHLEKIGKRKTTHYPENRARPARARREPRINPQVPDTKAGLYAMLAEAALNTKKPPRVRRRRVQT